VGELGEVKGEARRGRRMSKQRYAETRGKKGVQRSKGFIVGDKKKNGKREDFMKGPVCYT